jgi:hypothetical protein
MTLKIVDNSSPGDANHWGGNDIDALATAINLGEAYSYLIIKSGGRYYAKNSAGEISTSNTNFGSLISGLIVPNLKIVLGPGDFSLTNLLTITADNLHIEGCGIDITRILFDTPLTNGTSIRVGTTNLGTSHALNANALKGQRVITAASTTGIVAGDWIFLTHLVLVDVSSATRYNAEFHKVASVDSGTQITVEDNLQTDFNTVDTSEYYKVPWTKNFNLRNLTIYDNRPDNSVATAGDGPVHTVFNYGLRVSNVKFEKCSHDSIRVEGCFDTILSDVCFETPTSVTDDPDHEYGLYICGNSTNTQWNGGWANRCRHSTTNNTNSGGVYRRGKQRNITINGVTSFNANVAHFDLHQCALGATFTGCTALSGQHETVSVDVQGFNLRSPASVIGCVVQGCTHESIIIWVDGDVAGDDFKPGANRTSIIGTQIISTLKDDVDTVRRGIIVQANRSSVIISGCQFYDLNQESIIIEDGCKHVIVTGNMFHSVGANLVSTNSIVKLLGNTDDIIVSNNDFCAGTPAPTGRPLVAVTSVDHLIFTGNDVSGLTNKLPTIPAISTDVCVKDNAGLNPINRITNHTNVAQNQIGFYGGTTATVVASTDYTIVGSNVLITSTGGTGVSITLKDGAGNTVVAALTTLSAQTIPLGFKINWGPFSVAPTVTVFAV